MNLDSEHEKNRLKTQALLLETVADLIAEDPESAAAALVDAAAAVLAKAYPADLDKRTMQQIRENNPDSSDADARRRAMSEDGVLSSLMLSMISGQAALDFHPPSYISDQYMSDAQLQARILTELADSLKGAFDKAQTSGLPALATTIIAVNTGVCMAEAAEIPMMKTLRVLFESIQTVMIGDPAPEETEAEVVGWIAASKGISMEEAQRDFDLAMENISAKLH